MFDAETRQAIGAIAEKLGVEPAALLAVAKVESNGQAFADVDGRKMPLIRWECHYFHRLLPEALRAGAIAAKLAHPTAGHIPNSSKQQVRYDLLARARAIHNEAALSSCSWGLGQVMGSHWKSLGFNSVEELVETACAGIGGQVEVMARFIRANNLVDELKRKDWAAFARAYNGPNYKVNRYETKMADAYGRYSDGGAAPGMGPSVLRIGSRGQAVSELQEKLRKVGYYLHVDGDFGMATRKAVMDFQRDQRLEPDGLVGPQTWAVLERLQGFDPEEVTAHGA